MAKQVKITWTQSTGNTVAPTSHIVQRSATENGTYTTIYTALGVTAEHTDINVLDGETWWYRVGAFFASGTIKYLAAEDITISTTSSTILFSSGFDGVEAPFTSDTDWLVVNPTANNRIEKNNALEVTIDGACVANDDYTISQNAYPVTCVTFDIQKVRMQDTYFACGARDLNVSSLNYMNIQRGSTAGTVRLRVGIAGVGYDQDNIVLSLTTLQSIKIFDNGTTITFYYHDGTDWIQLGIPFTHTISVDLKPFFWTYGTSAYTETYTVDNFAVTNANFLTLRPV